MHCNNFTARPLTRRDALKRCASGFGAVALSSLLNDRAFASPAAPQSPLAPKLGHRPPTAKNVIFLR